MLSDQDVRWLLSLTTLYFASNDVPLPFAFVAFSFFLGLACVIIPLECAFHAACWFDVTLKGPIFHAEFFYVYAIFIFCFCMFYNHLYEWLAIYFYVPKTFPFNFEQEELKSFFFFFFFFSSKPLFMHRQFLLCVDWSGTLVHNFCL